MIAWRITKRQHASARAVLGGTGARAEGGRWNDIGLPLVYASANPSLALLETIVQNPKELLPGSLVVVSIDVPEDLPARTITVDELPAGWMDDEGADCRALGSEWIRSKETLALFVPSVVVPLDSNLLLNPLHPAIARCSVSDSKAIRFDPRLPTFARV